MERWRPALNALPGSLAHPARLRSLFDRGAAVFRGVITGPWLVWKKRYPDRQVSIFLQQRLFGVILLAAVVLYLLNPGLVTVTVLVGLAGIAAWGFFWSRSMALRVSAGRQLRFHAVQVGDELEETFSLTNVSGSPVLWAEVVDHSDMPGYMVSSVRAANAHETIPWHVRAACSQRGVFQLGPWELHLGDPFGIFRVIQAYTDRREILVYPPLADLPRRMLPHQRLPGDSRPLRQPFAAETILALSARPFAPGDPLRHIHWRTTARKQALFSKQFEPEAASRVWLVPDFDADCQLTLSGESTLETAVTMTATLASLLLAEHIEVGLAAYADRHALIRPQRGPGQLWPILLALAPLKTVFDQPLMQTLIQLQPLIHARDLVIIITSSLSPDWPPVLRRLTGGTLGGAAAAYLIDPATFGGNTPAKVTVPLLASLGIETQVIGKGDLKLRKAAYGAISRWEFKVLGTGRVIVQHAPRTGPEGLPGFTTTWERKP